MAQSEQVNAAGCRRIFGLVSIGWILIVGLGIFSSIREGSGFDFGALIVPIALLVFVARAASRAIKDAKTPQPPVRSKPRGPTTSRPPSIRKPDRPSPSKEAETKPPPRKPTPPRSSRDVTIFPIPAPEKTKPKTAGAPAAVTKKRTEPVQPKKPMSSAEMVAEAKKKWGSDRAKKP